MEEQRISRMYLNLVKRSLENLWYGIFGKEHRRSGVFPLLIISFILLATGTVYLAHRHAKFHELESKIQGEAGAGVSGEGRPGGREPVVLTRSQTLGGYIPEFHSATFLPGQGLDVLQITAFLPNRGEQPLLVAPSIQQMTDSTWPARSGPNDVHGALELPWSGSFEGVTSPTGLTLSTQWNGKLLTIPVQPQQTANLAEGGLLQGQDTDSTEVKTIQDGTNLTGTFRSRDFDGHWPSTSDVAVSAELLATTLDLTVKVKNVGELPEPMGIGWHPRFLVQSGDRGKVQLTLPNGEKLELADRLRGTPNGRMSSVDSQAQAFAGRPSALRDISVDEALVHFKPTVAERGPVAELRDPAAGYGLRVTAVSASVHELRVYAPAGGNFVSLGAQTNYDDPLGREWTSPDEAVTILQPGQTLEWKLRLELFPLTPQ